MRRQQRAPRAWYLDALSSLAYFALALVVAKAARGFGPLPALFAFVILAGLGWYFGKSAWRGLLADRQPPSS